MYNEKNVQKMFNEMKNDIKYLETKFNEYRSEHGNLPDEVEGEIMEEMGYKRAKQHASYSREDMEEAKRRLEIYLKNKNTPVQ